MLGRYFSTFAFLGITSRATLNVEGPFAGIGNLKVEAGSHSSWMEGVYSSIVLFAQGAKGYDTTGMGVTGMIESLVCMPTVADAAKFWCVLIEL